ncbi:unnamed protein product [Prunus armeniaca]|uniref:Endonuclease/exonuclease/phosphatase domain-containing protein n=1 Tax=Prunus armeniaca TaxID=36596 RepID=A0A6J5VDP5_PRUAR|nr:unnamed protein product [Prunus armeniaca]
MVWRLLTVYARTDERVHHRQWHTLNERILRYNEPCIVVGDFNDILDSSEKAGGNPRDERSMAAFREFVSDFMLMDLGFDGYPFTWRNRRESGLIQERLDRGLTLEKWLELYPEARVTHQILSGFDHTALLLIVHPTHTRWKGHFVYDLQWGKEERCKELVEERWQKWVQGSMGDRIFGKLGWVRQGIIQWRKSEGRNSKVHTERVHDQRRHAY